MAFDSGPEAPANEKIIHGRSGEGIEDSQKTGTGTQVD